MPNWYRLIQAAKYLGVAPWDLAQRPVWWMNIAVAAQNAEHAAEQARKRKEANRSANRR